MAYVCVESIVMFFFLMIREIGSFALAHWGLVISVMIILFLLSRFLPGWLVGVLGDAEDSLTDLIGDALAQTFFGTLVFAGIGGAFTSIIWVFIILTSKASFFLKVISAPFFFLAGALVGIFPIPTPGLTTAIAWSLDQETFADLACLSPFIIIVIIVILIKLIIGQDFCSFLNDIMNSFA
ncbi:hypothetical protein HN681_05005 [archaeon]|jgi:hypothetical protein|nr:hypothetical protein [archaeon]MBT3731328.1 hypothetical protein [archaeon]MBT4670369.1 hypothetical protein [archaeon]MBT5030196.1 hypothetical protein [archaeon]MBT5287737.1 hypothetical protein [archaeon]